MGCVIYLVIFFETDNTKENKVHILILCENKEMFRPTLKIQYIPFKGTTKPETKIIYAREIFFVINLVPLTGSNNFMCLKKFDFSVEQILKPNFCD